jgi:GNAT superfamily N-acetyltransferase
VVRPADHDDLEDVARLVDLVVPSMPGPRQGIARTGDGEARFGRLVDSPDSQLLVACLADGTRAGAAMLSVDAVSMALGGLIMSVVLIVDDSARQRGVGRELVSAVARYADEAGADAVTVSLPPGNREAHRFFSRLGFVPLVTNRIASVPQLMRALAPSDIAAERRQSVLLRARRPFGRRSTALTDARMTASVRTDRPLA